MTDQSPHRFPCDQCGAAYRFDPATGELRCDHCGHAEPIGDAGAGPWRGAAIRELDFRAAIEARLAETEFEETRVIDCPSCGAQTEIDERIHGTNCPFCATPVVAGTGTNRHIKPKAVLPFAFDETTARASVSAWFGRLWFAPSGLQRYARQGRRMDGVYVPYWTFDANTRSQYRGQRGTVYYETQTVVRNGERQRVRVAKIRWRAVAGRVQRFFDDVLILGSRALPKRFTDALPPWDLSALRPYTPEYLAGLRAEAYTVELDDAFAEARILMDRTIARDVRFDIGGDRQRIDAVDTEVADVTFKHILLPIWIAAYKYRGTSYRIVVNGQTGRVQGERPWSVWKIALTVILALLLAAALGFVAAESEGLAVDFGTALPAY